jgi:hypothetical protein
MGDIMGAVVIIVNLKHFNPGMVDSLADVFEFFIINLTIHLIRHCLLIRIRSHRKTRESILSFLFMSML